MSSKTENRMQAASNRAARAAARKIFEKAHAIAVAERKKAPPKLSPQEDRVYRALLKERRVSVTYLYRRARALDTGAVRVIRLSDRKMQQHVGVIIARLNKKRRKFLIVPGGKAAPRTYRITRRR